MEATIVSSHWLPLGRSRLPAIGYDEAILAAVKGWSYPHQQRDCRMNVPVDIRLSDDNEPVAYAPARTACDRLKAVIARKNSAPHGPSEYRCEPDLGKGFGKYDVFALRSNYPTQAESSEEWVGSSLVGWYAVSRTGKEIYLWEVRDNVVGARISDPG